MTAERNRVRNRTWKSRVRTEQNKLEDAVESANVKTVEANLSSLYTAIDKAVSKGVIHANTAARKKSRLAKKVVQLKTGK